MPGGLQITSSTVLRQRDTFRAYCEVNRRDRDYLEKDQTRKLATDLYVETAAIAPSKAEIAAEVKMLGWRIPTRFADGRLGRGVAKMWLGLDWAKRQSRVRKRGRKSKKDHLAEAEAMAQRPTLAQMQRFVVEMRAKARLYLASGWLGAVVDLGGSVKARGGGDAGSGKVDRDRGGAFVTRAQGLQSVTFWNRTPGIETQQAKHDFIGKAKEKRLRDMWVYIHRKRDEWRSRLRQAA